jgi:hypothetical protein
MARILFDEYNHTYTDSETGEVLTPVSTLIASYKNAFNPTENTLRNSAMKEGLMPEDVQPYWDLGNKYSQVKGTALHLAIEIFFRYGKIIDSDFEIWAAQLKKAGIPFGGMTEDRVYSLKYSVCGTLDYRHLYQNAKSEKEIVVRDWKSNKRIETEAYNSQRMKGFLYNVPDCNYYHYALQMSLYALMLEMEGYIVKELWLHHFNPATKILDHYRMPYYKNYALKMLESGPYWV